MRLQADPEPEPGQIPAVDIDPRVQNAGHRKVIEVVLPRLKLVMLSEEHCRKTPRDQVKQALLMVPWQDRIWGAQLWYTRKRTVEDLVLQFYFDAVRATL